MTLPYDVPLSELRRRRSVKWQQFPPDVLPMHVAETDFLLADPIRAAVADLLERGDTGYALALELPVAYAEFAANRYGQVVDPDSALLVGDVMEGVYVALGRLTDPGAGVVICPPVYHPFFDVIPRAGRRTVHAPLARDPDTGRYEFDLAALEAAFAAGAAAFLLCNPHNPVGRVWTPTELGAVAALADRFGVLVLADEIHGPLTFAGHPHTPFASVDSDSARRAVSFVSASKAWNLPGLKCALALAPDPAARDRFGPAPNHVSIAASILGVAASVAAFRDGGPWLDGALARFAANGDLLGELMAQRLPGIGWARPEGTYLAWLECAGLGADPAAEFLATGRVALDSGLRFGMEGAGFARFNLGTSAALVTEAVDRMALALR